MQDISLELTNYIAKLTSHDLKQNREMMNSSSVEEYMLLVQKRMSDISMSFGNCLHVLAEEQKTSRHWRQKFLKLNKEFKSLTDEIERSRTLTPKRYFLVPKTEFNPSKNLTFPPVNVESNSKIDKHPKNDLHPNLTEHTNKPYHGNIFIPSVKLGLPVSKFLGKEKMHPHL
jgi:hypothetical protein